MKEEKKEKALYIKMRDRILEEFSGLPYYSPLPSERELCTLFGASRPTIRKALELLEKEEKVLRLKGKGNFFMGGKLHTNHQIATPLGFYNDAHLQGKEITSKILRQSMEKCSAPVALKLGLLPEEEIFHLERIRYLDGELYSLTNSYIPIGICPDLLTIDFSGQSLYKALEEYGVKPFKASQTLEVKPADRYEALYLKVKEGEPISVLSCVTSSKDGTSIEFVTTKTKAYQTKYEIEVTALLMKKNEEDISYE